jgi:DNA-directed RNA polymerase specialized sigma24 family protein
VIDDSMLSLRSEAGTARLTQAALDRLLTLLDPDPDKAAHSYLGLHFKLVKLFAWEGVLYAEALADETLNRLAWTTTPVEDLPAFVFGIARNVLRQHRRDQHRTGEPPPSGEPIPEERMERLDEALGELPPEERDLILGYYEEGKPKAVRRDLCTQFGLSPNALRIRVCRIKEKLLGRLLNP